MLPEKVVFSWYATMCGASWDSISERDRKLLLVYEVELQVANGGFHQFFLHCGHRCEEMFAALAIVGCDRIAILIRQAMEFLPPGVFLRDDSQRSKHLWKIGKEAEAHLDRLTEDYYALCPQEPYEKMRQYLERERQDY